MITLTYEVLGKHTMLSPNDDDGAEVVDEFNLDVDFTINDIVAFYKSDEYKKMSDVSKSGYKQAIKDLKDAGVFDFLEDDEEFSDFLKDRYLDKAEEAYKEETGEYAELI